MPQNLKIEFISKELINIIPDKYFYVILNLNDHLYKYMASESMTSMIENYPNGQTLAIFKKSPSVSLLEGGKGQPEVVLQPAEPEPENEYVIDVTRSQIELTTITLSKEDRELLREVLGTFSAIEILNKGLTSKHASLIERLYHSF